jgi:3-oxoacyl-[acyl-carrier protein] reductase
MNDMKRTILVTGASGHIGQGFVSHYLSQGFNVIGVANQGALAPREGLTLIVADLSEVGSGLKILEEAIKSHPKIDFVINNAARQDVALLENETPEVIRDIFQVNVSAIAEILSAVAISACGVQSILNITSIEAVVARPGHSVYGASKAALEALTRSAANELAPIRINGLRLGLIDRDGIREAWPEGVSAWEKRAPLGRMGTLKDVLRAADFLLEATWISGSILTLDGGISAAPNW